MLDEPETSELSPYRKGFKAGLAGEPEDDNPFEEGMASWCEWRKGWQVGDAERALGEELGEEL
jgi:ribosome modulation factor